LIFFLSNLWELWHFITRTTLCCAVHVMALVHLFVCVSVTSLLSVETAEWIELVFGSEATLGLSYIVL